MRAPQFRDVPGIPERAWASLRDEGCWVWTRKGGPNGYGRVVVDGRRRLIHRIMWEKANGPVPDGLQLDHLCRNRACRECTRLRGLKAPRPRVVPYEPRDGLRTHCFQGHSLDDAYVYKGYRHCRPCAKARSAARKQRLKAAV